MSQRLSPERETTKTPKLVRIIARLNVGGGAQQACMLHERLRPAFDTYLITGSLADGEKDMSYLLSSEQNVLRLPRMSRNISLISDFMTFWKIYRFLRQVHPLIVHTHTAKAGALGRFAAWLAGVPVIVHTYHGHVFHSYFGHITTRVFLSIERALGRISTRVIAISESQRQELSSEYRVAPQEKISVIHNGFDLDAFSAARRDEARKALGLKAEDFLVVWAGRLAPVKDVELLGSVVRKSAESGRGYHFLVVGDGTERAQLESLVKGCANVDLLGWRDDMPVVWRAADVALLTSRNEGTPTVLIEAMAAGVPFVATNVGAVQDVAVPPVQPLPNEAGLQAGNGFLTARTPEALINCLDCLSANPSLAQRMGSAGKAFVMERFSALRLITDVTSLYTALLKSKTGRVPAALDPSPQNRSKIEDTI